MVGARSSGDMLVLPALTTRCWVSLQVHLHPGGGHVAAPQQELRDPTSRTGHQPVSEV